MERAGFTLTESKSILVRPTMNKLTIALILLSLQGLTGCKWLPLIGLRGTSGSGGANNDGAIYLLIAGQSNGTSPTNGSISPVYTDIEQVHVTRPDDPSLTLFNPGPTNPQTTNAAWIKLAESLYLRYGQPVYIINVAHANTSTRRWKAELYPRIQAALNRYPIDAVLWVQGESDYGENISMEEGYTNLKFVIERARGIKNVPWFVALNSGRDESLGKPYLGTPERVLNSQRRIIADGLALSGPNLMYLHESDSYSEVGNGAEFMGIGLSLHADEWYRTLTRYEPWGNK